MGHLQAHLCLKNLGEKNNEYFGVFKLLLINDRHANRASDCLGEEIRLKPCLYNSFEFYISQQEWWGISSPNKENSAIIYSPSRRWNLRWRFIVKIMFTNVKHMCTLIIGYWISDVTHHARRMPFKTNPNSSEHRENRSLEPWVWKQPSVAKPCTVKLNRSNKRTNTFPTGGWLCKEVTDTYLLNMAEKMPSLKLEKPE